MKLSNEQLKSLLLSILCDGLYNMHGYGFELDYSESAYHIARAKLTNPCIEDVQLQMLIDGEGLTFTDLEGDNTVTLTWDIAMENHSLIPLDILGDCVETGGDADSLDLCLQYILFKEIIFG